MAFQFPLATLLRVRTIREESEERMLQQIGAEIEHTLLTHKEIDVALERVRAKQATHTGAPLKGSDLHVHYAELAGLRQSLEDLRLHLRRLEDLKNKQMNIYKVARQNREMLTDLDDTQRSSYDIELAKREQKMVDDNFAARRKMA